MALPAPFSPYHDVAHLLQPLKTSRAAISASSQCARWSGILGRWIHPGGAEGTATVCWCQPCSWPILMWVGQRWAEWCGTAMRDTPSSSWLVTLDRFPVPRSAHRYVRVQPRQCDPLLTAVPPPSPSVVATIGLTLWLSGSIPLAYLCDAAASMSSFLLISFLDYNSVLVTIDLERSSVAKSHTTPSSFLFFFCEVNDNFIPKVHNYNHHPLFLFLV